MNRLRYLKKEISESFSLYLGDNKENNRKRGREVGKKRGYG